MIDVRLATEDDQEGWNRVAESSPQTTFFHLWEWQELMRTSMSYETLRLIAEIDGEILGIFPGIILPASRDKRLDKDTGDNIGFKEKMFQKYNILWSPPDTIAWAYGGPAIIPDQPVSILDDLYSGMARLVKKRKDIIDWKISPIDNSVYFNHFKPTEYIVKSRPSLIIELAKSEEQLWKEMDKDSHRNAVNQAKKKGVEIRYYESKNDLAVAYKYLAEHAERIEMPLEPMSYYSELTKNFIAENKGKFYIATYMDQIVGILIVLYHNGIAYPTHIATPRKYSKLRAANCILWHSIIDAKNNGLLNYDLAGMPGEESHGIYKFKKGFGGDIIDFKWFQRKFKFSTIRKLVK